MGGSRFDALSRLLSRDQSRRGLARLLGSLTVAGPFAHLGLAETEAKRKKHKKHKRPVPPAVPDPPCIPACAGKLCGDDGCGGTCGLPCDPCEVCQDGRCVPTTDLQTDPANCGVCGTVCDELHTCCHGACGYPNGTQGCCVSPGRICTPDGGFTFGDYVCCSGDCDAGAGGTNRCL